jgi:hypothetical protein
MRSIDEADGGASARRPWETMALRRIGRFDEILRGTKVTNGDSAGQGKKT